MIDLTKVPEETRYIRNREVAENGYDMQETANSSQIEMHETILHG